MKKASTIMQSVTNNDFSIMNEGFDLSDYFQCNNVSKETQNMLLEKDIMAIPSKYADKEYYFAQETIDFIKYCRQTEKEYTFDVLADDDVQIRSLHSIDLWMPVIWVSSNVLLPLVIGLISNYAYDKLKGREDEQVKLDVSITVQEKDKAKTIHYKGDAKTFKEKFEKININDL